MGGSKYWFQGASLYLRLFLLVLGFHHLKNVRCLNLISRHDQTSRIPYHYENKTIPVNIRLEPAFYLHGRIYEATNRNITATAEILDDKLRNLTLTYQWSVKNKTIVTGENISQINYQFDRPDPDQFLKVLVFNPQNGTGTSQKEIVVIDPVQIKEPQAKLFLEHGELLNVTMNFRGGGPYRYCFSFCFNNTDCVCKPHSETSKNEREIIRYLRDVGNYTMVFTLENIVSRQTKNLTVLITDILHHNYLPYAPIVASIVAFTILMIGFGLHQKFKRSLNTETADFDFFHQHHDDTFDDVWHEEQSFLQKVKHIIFEVDWNTSSASMTDSNISSSRARLVF